MLFSAGSDNRREYIHHHSETYISVHYSRREKTKKPEDPAISGSFYHWTKCKKIIQSRTRTALTLAHCLTPCALLSISWSIVFSSQYSLLHQSQGWGYYRRGPVDSVQAEDCFTDLHTHVKRYTATFFDLSDHMLAVELFRLKNSCLHVGYSEKLLKNILVICKPSEKKKVNPYL